MKNKYPHIFEPITVRRMTVKNRIVMTPMGTNYGEQNGEMSFLHINYYEQRAKGGTGLIIVENASVDSPQGSNGTTQLRIDLDNYIPRLFKLCESVHKHGACIAIQLNHAGASAMSSRIGMQPVSASDVPSKAGGEIPRPLEKDEIMQPSVPRSAASTLLKSTQDTLTLSVSSFHLSQTRELTSSAALQRTVQDLQSWLSRRFVSRLDLSSLFSSVSVQTSSWRVETHLRIHLST